MKDQFQIQIQKIKKNQVFLITFLKRIYIIKKKFIYSKKKNTFLKSYIKKVITIYK